MNRFATILAVCLATTTAFAQEKKEEPAKAPEYVTNRDFKQKIFEVKNRPARAIYSSIAQLGSGFKGAALSYNSELETITVRDFPENIATIEEAIRRLDVAAPVPDVDLRIWVLLASNQPLAEMAPGDDLDPVVRQLKSTLRFAHYGQLASSSHRTTPGRMIRGSGVANLSTAAPATTRELAGTFDYSFRNLGVSASPQRTSVDVEDFSFSMKTPFAAPSGGIDYRTIGFNTAVSIRDNEKVVIGTTTLGDKALIVVVTAQVAGTATQKK